MALNRNAASDALAGQRVHLRRGVDLQVCHSPGQSPALVFLHGGPLSYGQTPEFRFCGSFGDGGISR